MATDRRRFPVSSPVSRQLPATEDDPRNWGYDGNGAKSNAKICWAWSDQAVSGLKGLLKQLGCVPILWGFREQRSARFDAPMTSYTRQASPRLSAKSGVNVPDQSPLRKGQVSQSGRSCQRQTEAYAQPRQ